MIRRMPLSRRTFLSSAGAATAALGVRVSAQTGPQLDRPSGEARTVASDEAYWQRVAAHYRVDRKINNLEAGYWGLMAAPISDDYIRHVERVNRESSYYARRTFPADLAAVRARVASYLRVDPDEIAFTRSATESLQCLISGYNRLKPGDAVLYADLDYPAMQNAMKWLAERRGVKVIRFAIPEPATHDNVIGAYTGALDKNPHVRLVLLTHVSNKTGLVSPVATITALARARGADTIVDAAHAIGQMDITVPDIGADFVGFNLHKWIGAPLGVAVFYIKKSRLADVDRWMGEEQSGADNILTRVHTGTTNFAAFLTIPTALDFHAAVGTAYKAARLRYLRDRWVSKVRDLANVQVLTPDDPRMSAGMTGFRFKGRGTRQDVDAVVETLLTTYGIFTRRSAGIEGGDCVRVTPALYTTPADVDRLATALHKMARSSSASAL